MAKSPEEMAASMLAALPEKTGKTIDQWKSVVAATGLDKHGQIVKHLKSEHGVTHGYANLIAHEVRGSAAMHADSADDLVAAQYDGPKAELRPIYDALVDAAKDLGSDVEIAPKKTYVSLRRNKQFAIVKPSTRTRVDVGLNLDESTAGERLQPAGSMGMVRSKVAVTTPSEVDQELIGWLRAAYEQS